MAGAACSAGIVKLEWQETGGSLAGGEEVGEEKREVESVGGYRRF